MSHVLEEAERARQTQSYRRVLYSCQGVVALALLAVIAVPGEMVADAVAGLALVLMAVQHYVSRRLGEKSAPMKPPTNEPTMPSSIVATRPMD